MTQATNPDRLTKACHLEATINKRRHILGKRPRLPHPLQRTSPTSPPADTLPFDQDDGTCDTGWFFT